MIEQRYIGVKDVARFLGVSRWSIWRLVKEQEIPFSPVRKAIRFDKEEIVSWMKRRRVAPRAA